MNSLIANLFLVPMGMGSSILLGLLHTNSNNTSLFGDKSYQKPISVLLFCSFIYFVADFIFMMIKYEPRKKIFFLHHAFGIITIPFIYFNHYHLVKYLLAYLTFELTTPLLNLAINNRQKNIISLYSKTNDILFISLYTLVRVLFGSYLMFKAVPDAYKLTYPSNLIAVVPIVIQGMNYWWYYKIVSTLFKKNKY